jgi:hypothetical protein
MLSTRLVAPSPLGLIVHPDALELPAKGSSIRLTQRSLSRVRWSTRLSTCSMKLPGDEGSNDGLTVGWGSFDGFGP